MPNTEPAATMFPGCHVASCERRSQTPWRTRDYAKDRTPIVIEVRPGHVAVTSPGRLPSPVTIATLRDAQAPRNHTVIDVLRRLGLAKDSGQGIDAIQDNMRFELPHELHFEEVDNSFRITLRLHGLISTSERGWLAEYEHQGCLREGDRVLLLTVMRDERLTNGRARQLEHRQRRSANTTLASRTSSMAGPR